MSIQHLPGAVNFVVNIQAAQKHHFILRLLQSL